MHLLVTFNLVRLIEVEIHAHPMIAREIEENVIRYERGTERVLPLYSGHSISNIPHSISAIFRSQAMSSQLDKSHGFGDILGKASKIVLVYLDGVSYDTVAGMENDQGFLGRTANRGIVSPLTTVFPSTTAAACTSLNTGLSPIQHGLLEWQLYFHETGALMYTLPFKPVTKHYASRARRLSPTSLFNGESVYGGLVNSGIKSFAFLNKNIASGAYTNLLFGKSRIIPYAYLTDCIVQLRKVLEDEKGPLIAYVYLESADSIGHAYGPETDIYTAEVENISRMLKLELLDKISHKAAEDIGIVFTSDHGLVQTEPKKTTYLERAGDLWPCFEKHLDETVPPCGSPRDLFFHIGEGMVDEVLELLTSRFSDIADTLTIEGSVRRGYFGSPEHDNNKFRQRSGNLLLLPHDQRTVWYRMKSMSPIHLKGLHGGMSRREMIVPLGISMLKDLL